MKPAKSELIEQALNHIRDEQISAGQIRWLLGDLGWWWPMGRQHSGYAVLQRLEDALQSILDGVKPEIALELTRTEGKPADPEWDYIARVMHNNVRNGVKRTAIDQMVNEYLESIGRNRVSRQTINEHYERRLRELESQDALHELSKLLRAG